MIDVKVVVFLLAYYAFEDWSLAACRSASSGDFPWATLTVVANCRRHAPTKLGCVAASEIEPHATETSLHPQKTFPRVKRPCYNTAVQNRRGL